jgi:DNA repair protein RecO (recombination protein O)
MPLISTPAIILSTLRYRETSKIVRLATRDHGVQSAIAKGALRPRSRFGAALQVLSGGQAHVLLSDRRDLHTLTAFDLVTLPVGLAEDVGRYATATALAEVMLRVAPAEPHPEGYDVLEEALRVLATASGAVLSALAIKVLWRLVAALGFAPALENCIRDGRQLDPGPMSFSAPDGGALCGRCSRESESTALPTDARAALEVLTARSDDLPVLDPRNAAAHRRLLARYIRYHLAEGATLSALEFWQDRAWNPA